MIMIMVVVVMKDNGNIARSAGESILSGDLDSLDFQKSQSIYEQIPLERVAQVIGLDPISTAGSNDPFSTAGSKWTHLRTEI